MRRKTLFILAILLCLGSAVMAGYNIFTILSEYRTGEKASEELQQFIDLDAVRQPPAISGTEAADDPTGTTKPGLPEPKPAEEAVIYPEVDFESLRSINEDVVAWIYIEDTNINYPVVQAADNSRYLTVMVDGRTNAAGSIFMDYRNEPDFSDTHTVIYGHHMRNGSMFTDISKYKDPEYCAAHPTGMIMTPDGNFQFEVFAGYVASVDDPAWKLGFDSDADFSAWLQDTLERSTIGSTIVPSPEDRIITLSTCSYEFSNARFVLVCRIKT